MRFPFLFGLRQSLLMLRQTKLFLQSPCHLIWEYDAKGYVNSEKKSLFSEKADATGRYYLNSGKLSGFLSEMGNNRGKRKECRSPTSSWQLDVEVGLLTLLCWLEQKRRTVRPPHMLLGNIDTYLGLEAMAISLIQQLKHPITPLRIGSCEHLRSCRVQ